MFDIVSLGEILIDFTSKGKSEGGSPIFEANTGGAPCNVLAAMAKLGKKCAFIGKVGRDMFGQMLTDTVKGLGIDTSGLAVSDDAFTTLAFVSLSENGDREFSFARKNSADVLLSEDEVDPSLIANSRIFHFGTLSLTHPVSYAATVKALRIARENGVTVSTDPNLRIKLWDDPEKAKEAILFSLENADIIKASDYELEFIYGSGDLEANAKRAFDTYRPKFMFVTAGKDGAYMLTREHFLFVPCIEGIKTVDTTGAGDCFCGAALCGLIEQGLDKDLDEATCYRILSFANAAANLSTEKYGAIPSMPSREAVEKICKK